MLYKGTDKDAYKKASVCRTARQRSKKYYQEKSKNQKNKNKKENLFNFNFFWSLFKPKNNSKNKTVVSKTNINKPKVKKIRRIQISKEKIKDENKNLFSKVFKELDDYLKDKIIDFTVDLIKAHLNNDIVKIVDACQIIESYIKIANNIYKVLVKIDENLNETYVEYQKQDINKITKSKYKKELVKFRTVHQKYQKLSDIKTYIKNLEEWHLGDNKEEADKLFKLVSKGKKTATSYLLVEDSQVSKVGEYSVLTNWDKTKKIVVMTTKISIVEFRNVTEEHAFKEGEGDRTLQSWITIHKEFFSSILEKSGKKFTEDMKIVCEEFEVVEKLK